MRARVHKRSFLQRHLDPASRLGEILFGLIMVLTATLTAGLTAAEGRVGVRRLLISAIGCNIAWGIIDGIMYVMNSLTERGANARFIRAVKGAPDPEDALAIVRAKVDAEFEALSSPEEREILCRAIFKHVMHARPAQVRVTKEDLYGALACFWLVFFSCLPAALPFLIFSNPTWALRISNGLLIVMLFLVGHRWARYASTHRLAAGLVMVVIGLVLVGVAILLGG
jgi:VIT1/CCC1 family predicted Fe2+/Mn2+ transporter